MYLYTYMYIHICIHVYMYTCIYVYMYVCIYVYMYICLYVWIYIYIYMYMYIYIYICIWRGWKQGRVPTLTIFVYTHIDYVSIHTLSYVFIHHTCIHVSVNHSSSPNTDLSTVTAPKDNELFRWPQEEPLNEASESHRSSWL